VYPIGSRRRRKEGWQIGGMSTGSCCHKRALHLLLQAAYPVWRPGQCSGGGVHLAAALPEHIDSDAGGMEASLDLRREALREGTPAARAAGGFRVARTLIPHLPLVVLGAEWFPGSRPETAAGADNKRHTTSCGSGKTLAVDACSRRREHAKPAQPSGRDASVCGLSLWRQGGAGAESVCALRCGRCPVRRR
jgi:hypothetical protein